MAVAGVKRSSASPVARRSILSASTVSTARVSSPRTHNEPARFALTSLRGWLPCDELQGLEQVLADAEEQILSAGVA